MVERREYESYIRNRVKKLLENTTDSTYQTIAQIRQFAGTLPDENHNADNSNQSLKELIQTFEEEVEIIMQSGPENIEELNAKINNLTQRMTGEKDLTIVSNFQPTGYTLNNSLAINPVAINKQNWGDTGETLTQKLTALIKEFFEGEELTSYIKQKLNLYSIGNYNLLKEAIQNILLNQPDLPEQSVCDKIKEMLNKPEKGTTEKNRLQESINSDNRKIIQQEVEVIVPLIIREIKENKTYYLENIQEVIKKQTAVGFTSFINKKYKLMIEENSQSAEVYKNEKKQLLSRFGNIIKKQDSDARTEFFAMIESIINEINEKKSIIPKYDYKYDKHLLRISLYKKYIRELEQKKYDTAISLELRNAIIEDTINKVMEEIIHTSASNPLRITKYPKVNIAQINGIFVPINFIENLVEEFPNVLENAMTNSYIFLSNYLNIFFDEDNNKYLLPNQNIHIFGLDKSDDGKERIITYLKSRLTNQNIKYGEKIIVKYQTPETNEELNEYLESYRENENGELELKPLELRMVEIDRAQMLISAILLPQEDKDKYELLTYFIIKKGLKLSERIDVSPQEEIDKLYEIILENRTYLGNEFISNFNGKPLKEILKRTTDILKNPDQVQSIKNKYDEIFRVQKFLNSRHQEIALEIITQTTLTEDDKNNNPDKLSDNQLLTRKIMSQFGSVTNALHMDQENNIFKIYADEAKTNPVFSIEKEGIYYTIKRNDSTICSIKSNAPLTVQQINRNYIVNITPYGSVQISSKKNKNIIYSFDVAETITSPKVEVRRANLFGLVHLYLKNIEKEITNRFKAQGNSELMDYKEDVNLIKVYDKLIYLNLFNYVLDLENVYVIDLQNYIKMSKTYSDKGKEKKSEIGIICEISAFREKVFVLFEKMFNDITRFVSIQGISETNSIDSTFSVVPSLIDFNQKKYKTLVGLTPNSKDKLEETFFNTHTSITKTKQSFRELLERISKSEYVLRYATASNNETQQRKRKILSNSKEISIEDLIVRTLKGISNTLLWLSVTSTEEISTFLRKKDITKSEEVQFKQAIYIQIQNDCETILGFLKNLITQNDITPEEKNKYNEYITSLEKYISITVRGCRKKSSLIEKIMKINPLRKESYENFTKGISDEEKMLLLKYLVIDVPPYMTEHLRVSELDIDAIEDVTMREIANLMIKKHNPNIEDLAVLKSRSLAIDTNYYRQLLFIEKKLSVLDLYYRYLINNTNSPDIQAAHCTEVLKQKSYYLKEKRRILEEEKSILSNQSQPLFLVNRKNKKITIAINTELRCMPSTKEIDKRISIIDKQKELVKVRNNLVNGKEISKEELDIIKTLILDNDLLLETQKAYLHVLANFINIIINNNPNQNKKALIEIEGYFHNGATIKRIEREIESYLRRINNSSYMEDYISQTMPNTDFRNATDRVIQHKEELIKEFKNKLLHEYYPMIFELVNSNFSLLTLEEKQDIINHLLSRIEDLFEQYDMEFMSYEELVSKIHIKKRKEDVAIYTNTYTSKVEEIIKNREKTEEEKRSQLTEELIRSLNECITAKRSALFDTITSINFLSKKLLFKTEYKETKDRIDEQIKIEDILKKTINLVVKYLNSPALLAAIGNPLKVSTQDRIAKRKSIEKEYKEWLLSIPDLLNITMPNEIFSERFKASHFIELVELSFNEYRLACDYGDGEINNHSSKKNS